MLKQKGSLPYSYVDSFKILSEISLPDIQNWKNSPKDNIVDITLEEHEQHRKLFREFNCANLKEFLELYLTGDVLQLACWFEALRAVFYETYGLDCVQFSSTPRQTCQGVLASKFVSLILIC